MNRYPLTKAAVALRLCLASPACAKQGMVKVFILAGQSNLEGHGQISSLDHLDNHPAIRASTEEAEAARRLLARERDELRADRRSRSVFRKPLQRCMTS